MATVMSVSALALQSDMISLERRCLTYNQGDPQSSMRVLHSGSEQVVGARFFGIMALFVHSGGDCA